MASDAKGVKMELRDHSKALDNITDELEKLIDDMKSNIKVLTDEGFFGDTADSINDNFNKFKKVFENDKEALRVAAKNIITVADNYQEVDQSNN